jgi:hypothetical protein
MAGFGNCGAEPLGYNDRGLRVLRLPRKATHIRTLTANRMFPVAALDADIRTLQPATLAPRH